MKLDNFTNDDLKSNLNIIIEKKIIVIEKGCSIEVLNELNKNIDGKEIKLLLVCDIRKENTNGLIRNLGVLKYLSNINKLSISSNSSQELQNIDDIIYIEHLDNFYLRGHFTKNINIELLKKFRELKSLQIEEVDINDKKKYELLDIFNLEKLSLEKLDLSKVKYNSNLKQLKICKELINSNLLIEKYPNLTSIELLNCKKIIDYSFLSELKKLENLNIRGTNIEVFPSISSEKMVRIKLMFNKKLKNIDAIFELKKLRKIALTDSIVEFDKIRKLAEFDLDTFYFYNKSKTENEMFNKIAIEKNLENSMIGFDD